MIQLKKEKKKHGSTQFPPFVFFFLVSNGNFIKLIKSLLHCRQVLSEANILSTTGGGYKKITKESTLLAPSLANASAHWLASLYM